MALTDILNVHFDIQIADYQCIKTIDTLVFRAQTADNKSYVVKLYRAHNRELVQKIQHSAPFLHFIKNEMNLETQAPPLPHFPLVDWEDEKRFVVVSDWIEGELPQKRDADLIQKLGEMMAQLHNAAEKFQTRLLLLSIDNDLIQIVKPKINNQHKYLIFNELDLEKAFCDLENFYKTQKNTPSVFGLIHSDLHFKNVLERVDKLIPIDFDELAYGHYLLDIAITFNEIEDLGNLQQTDKLKKQFFKGYKTHRVLPKGFKAQIIDFQRIASVIYLNWILNEGNEDLLENEKLRGFAQQSLNKIFHA